MKQAIPELTIPSRNLECALWASTLRAEISAACCSAAVVASRASFRLWTWSVRACASSACAAARVCLFVFVLVSTCLLMSISLFVCICYLFACGYLFVCMCTFGYLALPELWLCLCWRCVMHISKVPRKQS